MLLAVLRSRERQGAEQDLQVFALESGDLGHSTDRQARTAVLRCQGSPDPNS